MFPVSFPVATDIALPLPPSPSTPATNSSCCCRQLWIWTRENLNLNLWLLLPLESNKDSRFIRGWGMVAIIVDGVGRIDLWRKWDGGERWWEWKETKHLSSSLSAMSQTKNLAVHRAVKTFLSISRLCMCGRGWWRRRFCNRRRRWGWGCKCSIRCKAGASRKRGSSEKGRPTIII